MYRCKAGKKLTDKRKELNQKIDDYRNWLLELKIVDPACGSGAFLNQALDFLILEHSKLDELRGRLLGGSIILSDVETSILENNLYGVDINEEAVEIAKLSLWLRTARKGRKLNSLNNNLKCGNSLIDDIKVAGDKAFNWDLEFTAVFEKGGFDVVIGNPPYVVYIKSIVGENTINYLSERYSFAEYNPNTYALFTELAISKILKYKGQLGFIIPSSWLDNKYFSRMRNGVYSQYVRQIINLKNSAFDEIVETLILILDKEKEKEKVVVIPLFNLGNIESQTLDISILKKGVNPFIKKSDSITDKLDACSKLSDNATVYRGLETRDNSKWIFSEKINDSHKPILLGKDINRYSTYFSGSYVNFVKKEMKSNANEDFFKSQKILMRRTGNKITADIELLGYFALKNCYLIIPKRGFIYSILAQLNSKLIGYYHKMQSSGENKAFAQFKGEYVSSLPCLLEKKEIESEFEEKIIFLKELMKKENEILNSLSSIISLRYKNIIQSLKLSKWNELTAKEFFNEFEKQKVKLSLNEQSELLQYFEAQKIKAIDIKSQIHQTENEIDTMVYKLYELTEKEIEMVEAI
ncbi:Eco57I restriction-modification methylase domain-containing protein [Pedobacter psychrophilus]|uniref:Eco57I restriction-modification methylase domain-containing protein n=1 Tax=Pedobacter psychrophilus TaxID=1826909 RepID=UPI002936E3DA|nr:TaqI-like C-terminal specificity domain-containing protein [Pedobacter psychrophilus]